MSKTTNTISMENSEWKEGDVSWSPCHVLSSLKSPASGEMFEISSNQSPNLATWSITLWLRLNIHYSFRL